MAQLIRKSLDFKKNQNMKKIVVDSGVGNVRFQTEKAQQAPCNACCCVFCSSCDDIAGGGVIALWRHLSSFTPRMGCIGNFTKFRALPRKISSFFIASASQAQARSFLLPGNTSFVLPSHQLPTYLTTVTIMREFVCLKGLRLSKMK
jgi:hypothetical protein